MRNQVMFLNANANFLSVSRQPSAVRCVLWSRREKVSRLPVLACLSGIGGVSKIVIRQCQWTRTGKAGSSAVH